MRDPLLPGYFADPSIVRDGDEWFVFATIDPSGRHADPWRLRNFRD
jgi:arabinoxylan arabinofuranohydrolase